MPKDLGDLIRVEQAMVQQLRRIADSLDKLEKSEEKKTATFQPGMYCTTTNTKEEENNGRAE